MPGVVATNNNENMASQNAKTEKNEEEWKTQTRKGSRAGKGEDGGKPRNNTTSLPSVDLVIDELEEALANAQSNGARARVLKDWGRMFKQSENNASLKFAKDKEGRGMTFAEVFLRSKALEQVVTTMFEQGLEGTDDEVALLFNKCLEGDAAFHQKLYQGLQTLTTVTKGKDCPRNFVPSLAAMVSGYKSNPASASGKDSQLQKLDAEVKATEDKITGVEGDDLAALATKSSHTSAMVKLCEQKCSVVFSDSGATTVDPKEVEKSFANILHGLNGLKSKADDIVAQANKRSEGLEKRKNDAAADSASKMADVKKTETALTEEITSLRSKKAELEKQLEECNNSIAEVEKKRMTHSRESSTITSKYNELVRPFQSEERKIKQELDGATKEAAGLAQGVAYVEECKSALSGMMMKSDGGFGNTRAGCGMQFMGALEQHFDVQATKMGLLGRRLKFISKKVEAMKEELNEMKAIGMMDMAPELLTSMKKMEGMFRDAVSEWKTCENECSTMQSQMTGFINLNEGKELRAIQERCEAKMAEMKTMREDAAEFLRED